MRFRDVDDSDSHCTLQHFLWSILATAEQRVHATGQVQSQLRLAAIRARQRATIGREQELLRIYSLVRYGESIIVPLLWLLGVTAFLTALVLWDWVALISGTESVRGVPEVFFGLLFSPIKALLIQAEPLTGTGLGSGILLLAYQVLSLILLGFSVLAMRRVVRAEG